MSAFRELGLSAAVVEAIEKLGYETPTPIQSAAIPAVARGRDLIGQAQTGSGKTAAFGLPAMDYVDTETSDIQVLVLVPTRELAIQVAQAMRTFGEPSGVRVIAVFGGQPIKEQTEQIKREPHIAVGTPGRVMDLIRRGWLPLHSARYVVLDEADEMLSLGFLEDVEWILRKTPAGRQTMLFSATVPPAIQRLAERYLYDPEIVRIESKTMTVDTIRQIVVDVEPKEKLDALCDLIRVERPASCIVFRKRKVGVDELVRQLKGRGVDVSALHGGMTQGQRDGVMLKFRSERAKLLVATNVAARGLDISHVTHVISYDVPDDPEEYTHRIGRTGRVGRSGIAYTFAGRRDARVVADIERVTGATIEHIPASALLERLGEQPAAATAPATPVATAAEAAIATADEQTVAPEAPAAPAPPAVPSAPSTPKAEGRRRDPEPAAGSARLFVSGGRRHGIDRDQVIAWFRDNAGLEPGRVKVHHAFALVDVPEDAADEAIAKLEGVQLGGRTVRVERSVRQGEPQVA